MFNTKTLNKGSLSALLGFGLGFTACPTQIFIGRPTLYRLLPRTTLSVMWGLAFAIPFILPSMMFPDFSDDEYEPYVADVVSGLVVGTLLVFGVSEYTNWVSNKQSPPFWLVQAHQAVPYVRPSYLKTVSEKLISLKRKATLNKLYTFQRQVLR